MSAGELLVPLIDEESAGFWEGTARGELRMQMCTACGRLRFPPRLMCPYCQSTARDWKAVSDRGTVWSFVVPHPPLLPAYEALAPYNVILVALEEDPSLRMVGNLISAPNRPINEVDPADITIGQAVRVVFTRRPDGQGGVIHMPQWVRAWRRVKIE